MMKLINSNMCLLQAGALIPASVFACMLTLAFHWATADSPIADFNETGYLEDANGVLQWVLADATRLSLLPPKVLLQDGYYPSWKLLNRDTNAHHAQVQGGYETRFGFIEIELDYRLEADGDRLKVGVSARWEGLDNPIQQMAFMQDFDFEPRKRTFFAGDHGFDWETRYFYQFHLDTGGRIMRHADRNAWRWFGLEHYGKLGFRLWKAEGDQTPPLIMQEGEHMPYAVQIYDRNQSMLIEVEPHNTDLASRLRVDASGNGSAILEVLPAAKSVPGQLWDSGVRTDGSLAYTITFEAGFGDAAVEAQRRQLSEQTYFDRARIPMDGSEWTQLDHGTLDQHWLKGGYPFAESKVWPDSAIALEIGDLILSPQMTPLAFWPDGSVKWGLLNTALPVGLNRTLDAPDTRLTFRDKSQVAAQIHPLEAAETRVNIARVEYAEANEVFIETEQLSAWLGTGRDWLKLLEVEGKVLLDESAGYATVSVDYATGIENWEGLDGQLGTHHSEQMDFVAETVELFDNGPERAVVMLRGVIPVSDPITCYLWLEFRAGSPAMYLSHSFEIPVDDPRKASIKALNLNFRFSGMEPERFFAEGVFEEVHPGQPTSIGLLQLTPNVFLVEALREDIHIQTAAGNKAMGWAAAFSNTLSLVASMRNFSHLAPKSIVMRVLEPGTLDVSFGVWPKQAGAMDMRRYSEFPHRGQGELASHTHDYVPGSYYNTEPVKGLSRSHEVMLAFPTKLSEAKAHDLAADYQSPVLLFPGDGPVRDSKALLDGYAPDAGSYGNDAIENYLRFWLFHQKLHQWYGFWTYGDFRHRFQDGYGWIVAPEELLKRIRQRAAGEEPEPVPRNQWILDYSPANDWAFDNGRWGWGMTEGLPGRLLQSQYLKTGDRDLFFAAEAMARHARDVVIRHQGRWFGAGTRHGVQPWSDGGHEERQTTATEYKIHYYLTGDPRTRQVIEKLFNGHYNQTRVSRHADHSGRLQGLLFHWELSGNPAEGKQYAKYVQEFVSPEGIYEQPNVTFPGPVVNEPADGLNQGSMFFQVFGAMHALLEYQMIVRDPDLHVALIASADSLLNHEGALERWKLGRIGPMRYGSLGYAARYAEDPEPYLQFLEETFKAAHWQYAFLPVADDEETWTGDDAYLALNVSGSLFYMNFAPWMWGALSSEILSDPVYGKKMQNFMNSRRSRTPRKLSWQDEYDAIPELQPFLGENVPWLQPEIGEHN